MNIVIRVLSALLLFLSLYSTAQAQYFDAETKLNYNMERNYEPATDRYIESDPIGLEGGQFSTYAYVDGNPLSRIDPRGLAEYLGIGRMVSHLVWLAKLQNEDFWTDPDSRPERQMIERLRRGEETRWDIGFYHHEANEAKMCEQYRDLPKDEALRKQKKVHDSLESIQGGTVYDRYHPSVVNDNPHLFWKKEY